uniref:Uncharacterized protein n=1 Tax=Rhizophora mucronata TaxID=61149 RepID=A0A2P2KCF4_RHIMU
MLESGFRVIFSFLACLFQYESKRVP